MRRFMMTARFALVACAEAGLSAPAALADGPPN
jgi:hypothetical protein